MTSRRRLLAVLCLPATMLASADVSVSSMTPRHSPPWVRLMLRFDHRHDLAAVGEACLRSRPALRNSEPEGLYRALAHRVGSPTGSAANVLAALPAQIAADFECGAVENVGGWQLSHTEVLLAVLAAKSESHV